MTRTVLYFLGGALLCWLPLAALCDVKWHRVSHEGSDAVDSRREYNPRYWEHDGLRAAVVTGPICLVPTTLSLLVALWAQNRSAAEQLMAVLGGMALRFGVVLLVALAVFLVARHESGEGLKFKRPEREFAYWGSLLIFYLFTLGLETFLVARRKVQANGVGESQTRMKAGGAESW